MEETYDGMERRKLRPKFFGYSLWRLIAYFIIYSIVGLLVETTFCIIKYGVFESRQSFLYGPFCSIYGIGAIVIILSLQKFKKHYTTIFIGGCIVGSLLEYIVSFIGESIFHVKWWDYSKYPLNVNGRICLYYALFWGMLSLYLIISLNPKVDKIIDWIKLKINHNIIKFAVIIIILWIIIDFILTGQAIIYFMVRTIVNYDLDVSNKEEIVFLYNQIYSNTKRKEIIYKYFGDKRMLQTFPRLKIQDVNGNIIYFSSILTDIQPYYVRIWKGKE